MHMSGNSNVQQNQSGCPLLSVHQACKQTTSNPDANSDLRGWQLLLSILAVATPSKHLAPCFKKHCELGPVGSIPQTYAQYALSALHKVGGSIQNQPTPESCGVFGVSVASQNR